MSKVVRRELWLISCGDLVTVLVCLFVALLSAKHGKALAEGGGEHFVELALSDFDTTSSKLLNLGAKRLDDLKIMANTELTIKSCEGSFEALQLARTLAVTRQISATSQTGSITFSSNECSAGNILKITAGAAIK